MKVIMSVTKEQNLRVNVFSRDKFPMKGKQMITRLLYAGLLHERKYRKELFSYCVHLAEYMKADLILEEQIAQDIPAIRADGPNISLFKGREITWSLRQ